MTTNDPKDDGVLERNVETLLERGGEPPKLTDIAKARIRAHLIAKHATGAGAAPVARTRSPMIAIGIGLAATAAAALIVTRVVGGGGGGALPGVTPDGGGLADGSSWVTEPGAKVTVLGSRHVRVEGAALLDISPGQGTFVVETKRGRIEVLGTRFLVDAEADRTTAAVVRGQVKLATADGDVLLHAGEQAVAEPGRPPTRGPAPRLSHLVSWAEQARKKAEKDVSPIHHGTLFARDPGVRSHAPWGDEYPLPITKLGIDIVVEDQVARVALDQTFHNNANQDLEGVYRFAIPPDAALQRLAMYVDGKLTESAVVERMQARRIYEELVYRRVDPALLEWAGTGRLSLRVYPLPANQDKRLMLAYTQSLPKLYDDWTLSVPLPEIDQPVGEVAFDVTVRGCATCEITSTSHKISVASKGDDALVSYHAISETIGDSLVLHVRDTRHQITVSTHKAGDDAYVMVRAPADLERKPGTYRPRTWVILDDVSASRDAMERRAQADLVDSFMRELDEDDRVAVIAFDVSARLKLAPTRVLDVDRKALRAVLRGEGDVGATDFGAALAAATTALLGVAPDDAMIVYLGDGVITSGARNLDALRAQLVGRAHFIGVGVGDGPDTQTLEALAAATGGYATTIDLADDVGWRAFDLVAALHTARVTGVEARLVDASGSLVPSALYLRSPQLADGEEIELVAKLAGGGTPVAVELTGTLDGAPWQKKVPLAGTPTIGGFLPRMWAQRHIAARLLAKHEAVVVPPCSSTITRGVAAACTTEAQAREARDEGIRREVVGLGKKYFLLSRHTSLLVLENDAMYARFGVTKGAGDTWAPYAMPATVPIVRTAVIVKPADVADDAELVRSPLQIFYNYGRNGGYFQDDLGLDGLADRDSNGIGFGTIGHGAGTGNGYGVGGGRTRATLGLNDITTLDPASSQASMHVRLETKPDPFTGTKGDRANEDPSERPNAPAAIRVAGADAEPEMQLREGANDKTVEGRRTVVATEGLLGELGTRGGPAIGGLGKSAGWSGGPMMPQRLTYPGDAAFDDLTAFVPALVPDGSDGWRAQLTAAAGGANTHTIDDAAKRMLAEARDALPTGVYRWEQLEIAVDGAHRIGWHRTTETDLAETASFDGATFTRRYAELGLDVTRTLTQDDVALAMAYLPIWIADPMHYARWFEVRAKGPHQVTLAKVSGGKAKVAYVLEFDDRHHLVSIGDAEGHELLSVTWGAAGPTGARVLGQNVAVGFSGQPVTDAIGWAHGTSAAGVAIELPSHLPAYWQKQVAGKPVGGAEWRHLERQWMVAMAATNDRAGLYRIYEELRAHGGVELGDLTLASGGLVSYATDPQIAAALAPFSSVPTGQALPPCGVLGPPCLLGGKVVGAAQPALVRYVIAGRAYAKSSRPERLKPEVTTGLVGAMWQLREIAALGAANKSKLAIERLLAMGDHAIELRLIAAASLTNRYELPADDIARAWDAVAVGPYRNVARAQAAQALANRGSFDAAAERISVLVNDLDLAALPPELQQTSYWFQQSRRGQAGWQLVWTKWRDKALGSGSFEHVMALVPVAMQQPTDLTTVLARASTLAGTDIDRKVMVARIALQGGQPAFAQTVIDPLLVTHGSRELFQLAAGLALRQGRTGDALAHLEAAQNAAGDEAVDIGTVRMELTQIITVARQLAVQSAGPARDAVVARAMAWGARWRAIDAGNSQIDEQLGELMLAVGNKDEAWRQLSTVIERDPMSGTGYQTVAEAFERQGRVEDALPFWQQAIVIDQTNPTPRLRKAQALIALGRTADGDALLTEIGGRRWHEIWSNVVYQAKALQERGKPQR